MRILLLCLLSYTCFAQNSGYLLTPDRVFDGEKMLTGVSVFVHNDKIAAVGPTNSIKPPADVVVIKLPGCTLLPV